MGKKLGLDKSYNALKTVLGSYPITGGKWTPIRPQRVRPSPRPKQRPQ